MEALGGSVLLVVAIAVYFVPAMVAKKRNHSNATPVFLVNLFLGWTVIGWIAALIWANTDNANPPPKPEHRTGKMT